MQWGQWTYLTSCYNDKRMCQILWDIYLIDIAEKFPVNIDFTGFGGLYSVSKSEIEINSGRDS